MKKLLIFLAICVQSANAGNLLSDQVPVINNEGFETPNKKTYTLTQNMDVLFDLDIDAEIAKATIKNINNNLDDIKLDYSFSNEDLDNSKGQLYSVNKVSKIYAPHRIMVMLGGGFSPSFFAVNRVYEDGTPTAFVNLNKKKWDLMGNQTKQIVIEHELRHTLLWEHPSNNPYTLSSDYISQDNNEPLYRLYDSQNKRGNVNVTITNKADNEVVGFIPKKNKEAKSVFTKDDQVKLKPGYYKVVVTERYLCKPRRKLKYCTRVKKAKRFKISKDRTINLP